VRDVYRIALLFVTPFLLIFAVVTHARHPERSLNLWIFFFWALSLIFSEHEKCRDVEEKYEREIEYQNALCKIAKLEGRSLKPVSEINKEERAISESDLRTTIPRY
jgi:hypothetical protein